MQQGTRSHSTMAGLHYYNSKRHGNRQLHSEGQLETLNPLHPSECPHGAFSSFARKPLVKVMDNVIVFNNYSNLATPHESSGDYFRVACSSRSMSQLLRLQSPTVPRGS